ncbi:hypothetical protein OG216_03305 [Streptomycetaceae bacterium NBC_01309]
MPIDPFTALNAMLRAEAARNALASADALCDAAEAVGGKPRSEQAESDGESASGQSTAATAAAASSSSSSSENASSRSASRPAASARGVSTRGRTQGPVSRTRS